MTPQQVIDEVKEYAAEWLEMSDNPSAMVEGILAKVIIEQISKIEYLQRRLDHVSSTRIR